MRTHVIHGNDTGNVRTYISGRVFSGTRPLKGDAKKRYLAGLRKAVAKRAGNKR